MHENATLPFGFLKQKFVNAREFDSLTRNLRERRNENMNAKHFDNDLVEAIAQMILERCKPDPAPVWLCYVIHSGKKGGTLNGAEEYLRQSWVPFWIKPTQDKDAANEQLVNKGGSRCTDDVSNLDTTTLITAHHQKTCDSDSGAVADHQVDLFSQWVSEPEAEFEL